MTLGPFPAVTAEITDEEHFNNVQQAMSEDILPRNVDGDPEDLAGDIGTPTFPWLKLSVKTGHLAAGFIIPFYDYDGLLSLPHGYMICNGDQITRSAYNNQHRTSLTDTTDYWATYVNSSPFEDLYLPGGDGRFLMGSVDPTHDGLTPVPESGNPSSQIDLSHDHGGTLTTSTVANLFWDDEGVFPWDFNPSSAHAHNVTLPTTTLIRSVNPQAIDVYNLMRIVE